MPVLRKAEDLEDLVEDQKLSRLKLIHWVLQDRKPLSLFIVNRKYRPQIKKLLIWQLQPMLQLSLLVLIKLREEKNLTGSLLALPGNQNELIKSVAAVNPNTIVVIQGMGMVEVEQFKNNPNIAGIILDRIQWSGTGNCNG